MSETMFVKEVFVSEREAPERTSMMGDATMKSESVERCVKWKEERVRAPEQTRKMEE